MLVSRFFRGGKTRFVEKEKKKGEKKKEENNEVFSTVCLSSRKVGLRSPSDERQYGSKWRKEEIFSDQKQLDE